MEGRYKRHDNGRKEILNQPIKYHVILVRFFRVRMYRKKRGRWCWFKVSVALSQSQRPISWGLVW